MTEALLLTPWMDEQAISLLWTCGNSQPRIDGRILFHAALHEKKMNLMLPVDSPKILFKEYFLCHKTFQLQAFVVQLFMHYMQYLIFQVLCHTSNNVYKNLSFQFLTNWLVVLLVSDNMCSIFLCTTFALKSTAGYICPNEFYRLSTCTQWHCIYVNSELSWHTWSNYNISRVYKSLWLKSLKNNSMSDIVFLCSYDIQ